MILNIQTLRVLFTFLVVTAHLDKLYEVLGLQTVTSALTHISVDGFIVCSAFLIPYTHAQRPRPAAGFLGRRLARLVPFYWFMTLVVAALVLIAPQLFQNTAVTAETLFKSLFFIPYYKYADVSEPIVFVGWTMNYFIFYILLHTFSLRLFGARAWISTTLILVGLVIYGWVFKPVEPILETFTHARQLSFVAGLLLCTWWLHAREKIVPSPQPRWFKPACYGAALTALALITLRDVVFAGVNPRIIGPVFAAVLIGAAITLDRAGVVHRSRIRDTLAEAGFAIYLTHYFVTQAATKVMQTLDLHNPLALIVLLAASYVGVAVVGVCANRFVEIPLENFVRGLWNKRTEPAARPLNAS